MRTFAAWVWFQCWCAPALTTAGGAANRAPTGRTTCPATRFCQRFDAQRLLDSTATAAALSDRGREALRKGDAAGRVHDSDLTLGSLTAASNSHMLRQLNLTRDDVLYDLVRAGC